MILAASPVTAINLQNLTHTIQSQQNQGLGGQGR
jgi:hypothetical protein